MGLRAGGGVEPPRRLQLVKEIGSFPQLRNPNTDPKML